MLDNFYQQGPIASSCWPGTGKNGHLYLGYEILMILNTKPPRSGVGKYMIIQLGLGPALQYLDHLNLRFKRRLVKKEAPSRAALLSFTLLSADGYPPPPLIKHSQ